MEGGVGRGGWGGGGGLCVVRCRHRALSDWLGVIENYGQGRQDEKEGQRCRQRLARG